MNNEVHGRDNLVAGRDIYLQRVISARERVEHINTLFQSIDGDFERITGSGFVTRRASNSARERIIFSSEALCGSLIKIGMPILFAIEVVESIIPMLEHLKETDDKQEISTNDVKRCVLRSLSSALHFDNTTPSKTEINTWYTAYIRRYGSSEAFIKIIHRDNKEYDLNYEYIKEQFLPHVIEKIIGAQSGHDVIKMYQLVFTNAVLERMAGEIIGFANTLNVYTIRYQTLFYLINDVILHPPHPWMVSKYTINSVIQYNIDRARAHYNVVTNEKTRAYPEYFISSALECVVHICATILAYYGCMLGIESKYGFPELIRICRIKEKHKNIVMWEYSGLNRFESDLEHCGYSLHTFTLFLERMETKFLPNNRRLYDLSHVMDSVNKLANAAEAITGTAIVQKK